MSIVFTITEDFDVPPARVFRAMTDLEGFRHWMVGLVRIERLDTGPLQVGSAWRETRRVFGREACEVLEVTRLLPPTHFSLRCDGTRGTSGRGEFLFDHVLEPQAGGTRMVLRGEIRGLGGFGEIIGRLFATSYRKATMKDLAALRQHLVREVVLTVPHQA